MSLETTVSMYNQVTPVLNNIVSSLDILINEAKATENATKNMVGEDALKAMQSNLQAAGAKLKDIENQTIQNAKAQESHNQELKQAPNFLDGALGKLKMLVATYASLRGIKAFVGMADEYALSNARLNMVNDGTRTTIQLQDELFRKAQESGSKYTTMVDAFAKMSMQAGNAFNNSNDKVLEFTSLLNKQFAIAGTQGAAAESVLYNLTQALASGVLRGQDLNAILQNTPQIARMIEKQMGLATGQIRSAAEEGKVTSDIVVKSILDNKEKIEKEYGEMPWTFSKIATSVGNSFTMGLREAFQTFSQTINSEKFTRLVENAKIAGNFIAGVIGELASITATAFNFIADYGTVLAPIILGIAGAYAVWVIQTKILTAANLALMKSFLTNPYALAAAAIIGLVVWLSEAYKAMGITEDGALSLSYAISYVSGAIAVVSGAMMLLTARFAIFNAVVSVNPLIFIVSALVFIISMTSSWVREVGGLGVAWLIVKDTALTALENIIIKGQVLSNSYQMFTANIGLFFSKLFVGIQIGWFNVVSYISKSISQIINNFKNMINSLIGGLNLVLGIVGKEIPLLQTKTNDEIEKAAQANLDSKISIAQGKVTAKEKEIAELKKNFDKKLTDEQKQFTDNQMRRTAEIENAKYQAKEKNKAKEKESQKTDLQALMNKLPDKNGKDELGKSLKRNGNKLDKIAKNTEGINWRNNDLSSLRDLMEQRAITNLSKDFKIEISNNFTGNIDSDIDLESVSGAVSDRIARKLEMQFNAG